MVECIKPAGCCVALGLFFDLRKHKKLAQGLTCSSCCRICCNWQMQWAPQILLLVSRISAWQHQSTPTARIETTRENLKFLKRRHGLRLKGTDRDWDGLNVNADLHYAGQAVWLSLRNTYILCTGPLLISHECLALVCKTCKWILPIGATNNSAKQLNFCSTLTCIHPLSQWKIVSDVCVHRVHSFMYIHSVREAPYQAFKPPEQELLQPLNYSEKVFFNPRRCWCKCYSWTLRWRDSTESHAINTKPDVDRCRSNSQSKNHDFSYHTVNPFEISPTPTDGLRPTCTAPDL